MSDAWDGRPENPEQTAPHWIEDKSLKHIACVVWCHVMQQWHDMAVQMPPAGAAKWWRYLGPCLTPAEIAAREQAAREKALREAAALLLTHNYTMSSARGPMVVPCARAKDDVHHRTLAAAILALLDKEAAR